jgi:ABC-type phosphate/phosphonate transport system ATPase subunit
MLGILKRIHQHKKTLILFTNNVEFGYKAGNRFVILTKGLIAYECEKKDITMDALKEKYQRLLEDEI